MFRTRGSAFCSASRRLRIRRQSRRGAISVLAALLSIVLLGMVAFAVDTGYILSNKQELQRTADAAALAACWEYGQKLSQGVDANVAVAAGRAAAAQYAGQNQVANLQTQIDQNSGNSDVGDLVFGHIADLYNANATMQLENVKDFNAVRIRVRRDNGLNGEAPYFFAKVFGMTGQGLNAEATAGYYRNIRGMRAPASGGKLDLLPFALDWQTWAALLSGNAEDNWRWDAETQTIVPGSDGILEVNLYPQGTGSPGNRGTVDIGSSNNSTADIARQILEGISAADLAYHGGELSFNANGELYLNGDTGISAGVKDELASIKGEPRLIPIFSTVVGPGNNANYTIVHWAGIRIMEVKLTGAMKQKRVIVQPCPMVVPGVIPSSEETSSFVYTPVVLVK
jgi:Flp pilus assembly protein TadG